MTMTTIFQVTSNGFAGPVLPELRQYVDICIQGAKTVTDGLDPPTTALTDIP